MACSTISIGDTEVLGVHKEQTVRAVCARVSRGREVISEKLCYF